MTRDQAVLIRFGQVEGFFGGGAHRDGVTGKERTVGLPVQDLDQAAFVADTTRDSDCFLDIGLSRLKGLAVDSTAYHQHTGQQERVVDLTGDL